MEFNPILCAEISEEDGLITQKTTGVMRKQFTFMYDNAFVFKYQAGKEHPEYNQSIMYCCASGTKNRLNHGWSGPAVAYAHGQDMDATTYSDVVAWLIWYGMSRGSQPELRYGPKVESVKIACPGEQQLAGSAPYTSVQVPRMHPIFDSMDSKVSAISKAIGMPLITWKQPQTQAQTSAWSDVPNGRFSQAAYMHKGIDPSQQADDLNFDFVSVKGGFGMPPIEWDMGLGTVYIARVDREPLDPELVDAFGDFCEFHLSAFFQLCRERRLNNESSDARMQEIYGLAVAEATPAKWAAYLEDWRTLKAGVTNDARVNGRVDGAVSVGVCHDSSSKLSDHLLCSHH